MASSRAPGGIGVHHWKRPPLPDSDAHVKVEHDGDADLVMHVHQVRHRVQIGLVVVLNRQTRTAVGAQPLSHHRRKPVHRRDLVTAVRPAHVDIDLVDVAGGAVVSHEIKDRGVRLELRDAGGHDRLVLARNLDKLCVQVCL